MAKFCTAKKGQHCKDCKWHQIDDEESNFYGEYRYFCAAEPDEYGYVRFEQIKEKNMATYQDYLDVLARNYGTEHYYRSAVPSLIFTDGIKDMADTLECYWLISVVESYMPKVQKAYSDDEDAYFCKVILKVANNKADFRIDYFTYSDELEDEVATNIAQQHSPFTDMPDGEYELYLQNEGKHWTLFLHSEY